MEARDKQEAERTDRNSQEVGDMKMCGVEDKKLTSSGVGSMCVSSETSGVSGLLKELMKEQQNNMRDLVVEVELEVTPSIRLGSCKAKEAAQEARGLKSCSSRG